MHCGRAVITAIKIGSRNFCQIFLIPTIIS